LLDRAIEEADRADMPVRAARWRAVRREAAQRTAPPPIVVRRDQGRWLLTHHGGEVLVGDLVGMRYLARLIAEPGRAIAALELAGPPAGPVDPGPQPMLDARARSAYAERAGRLTTAVRQARADGDRARVEALEDEIEALTREMRRSTGLGGRARTFAGPAERARTAVRKAIDRALSAIEAEGDPTLSTTLRLSIKTGYECSYTPSGLLVA
jgi:hypothetical protein